MEWKYVKPLLSEDNINDFECLVKYCFPDEFRKCVILYNGGRPSCKAFNTDKTKERELKSFLSFNKEDKETVWKILEWNKEELTNRYVAFAIDNFGNLICFDANNDNIIFLNHENAETELIATNFSEFINALYD